MRAWPPKRSNKTDGRQHEGSVSGFHAAGDHTRSPAPMPDLVQMRTGKSGMFSRVRSISRAMSVVGKRPVEVGTPQGSERAHIDSTDGDLRGAARYGEQEEPGLRSEPSHPPTPLTTFNRSSWRSRFQLKQPLKSLFRSSEDLPSNDGALNPRGRWHWRNRTALSFRSIARLVGSSADLGQSEERLGWWGSWSSVRVARPTCPTDQHRPITPYLDQEDGGTYCDELDDPNNNPPNSGQQYAPPSGRPASWWSGSTSTSTSSGFLDPSNIIDAGGDEGIDVDVDNRLDSYCVLRGRQKGVSRQSDEHQERERDGRLPPSHVGSLEVDAPQNQELLRDDLAEVTRTVRDVLSAVTEFQSDSRVGQWSSALRTSLLSVCSNKDLYRQMLHLGGKAAQQWMDALQLVLDSSGSSHADRRDDRGRLLQALIRLSKASGLYPTRLHLSLQIQTCSDEPVADGAFGEVYRGRAGGQAVAIKVFRVNQRTDISKLMKTMWKEAILWCHLQHPNVLPCYGIHHRSLKSHRIGLVSPWMEKGNIVEYLHDEPHGIERLLLLSDIASGMSYLHENKIVHGDLKGANILVSTAGRACLADFGLSTLSDINLLSWTSVRTTTANATGTARWQAPELLNPEDDGDTRATTMSDIYSYACVCYEVMTGNIPFYQIKSHYGVPMLVLSGSRPRKPNPTDPAYERYGLTEPIWSFIEACWQHDALQRPTASEVQQFDVFRPLTDHRPLQQWGGGSAAEFRLCAVPCDGIPVPEGNRMLT